MHTASSRAIRRTRYNRRPPLVPSAPTPSARLVRAAAAERAELDRHRDRLLTTRASLRTELEAIEASLRELDERDALLDRLAGPARPAAVAGDDAPAAGRAPAPGGRSGATTLRGPAIRRAAVEVLLAHPDRPQALHYRAWFDALVAAGYEVAGKDPLAVFLTQLGRSPVVRRGTQSGVYELDPGRAAAAARRARRAPRRAARHRGRRRARRPTSPPSGGAARRSRRRSRRSRRRSRRPRPARPAGAAAVGPPPAAAANRPRRASAVGWRPMRHDRHYTLDEARELRGWVGARVDEARGGARGAVAARCACGAARRRGRLRRGWPGRDGAAADARAPARDRRAPGRGHRGPRRRSAASSTSRPCATARRSTSAGSSTSPRSSTGTSSTPGSPAPPPPALPARATRRQ